MAQDVIGGHGLNLALIGPFEQDQQEHFEQLLAVDPIGLGHLSGPLPKMFPRLGTETP